MGNHVPGRRSPRLCRQKSSIAHLLQSVTTVHVGAKATKTFGPILGEWNDFDSVFTTPVTEWTEVIFFCAIKRLDSERLFRMESRETRRRTRCPVLVRARNRGMMNDA